MKVRAELTFEIMKMDVILRREGSVQVEEDDALDEVKRKVLNSFWEKGPYAHAIPHGLAKDVHLFVGDAEVLSDEQLQTSLKANDCFTVRFKTFGHPGSMSQQP